MEAIIRHWSITCNGPLYSAYGNSASLMGVYCACCAKGSKAKGTAAHGDPAHSGSGGYSLPVLAARHSTGAFPSAHQKKGLPVIPFRIFKTCGCGLAQLIVKIYFLGGRVEGLPLFTST